LFVWKKLKITTTNRNYNQFSIPWNRFCLKSVFGKPEKNFIFIATYFTLTKKYPELSVTGIINVPFLPKVSVTTHHREIPVLLSLLWPDRRSSTLEASTLTIMPPMRCIIFGQRQQFPMVTPHIANLTAQWNLTDRCWLHNTCNTCCIFSELRNN
jgi:hypothetical protein